MMNRIRKLLWPSSRGEECLAADERGGMFAEAVIVLPAFILVWSLIIFVHDGFDKAQDAGVAVRQATWVHSIANTCEGSPGVDHSQSNWGIVGSLTSIAALITSAPTIVRNQPMVLRPLWFKKLAFELPTGTFSQRGTVPRARALGGSATYGHEAKMMCDENNEQPSMTGWIWAAALVMAGIS